MKKLILMLLLVVGGVMSASATTIYVCVDNFDFWDGHVRVASWGGNYDAKDFTTSEKLYIRGRSWYKYEMPSNNSTAQIRYYDHDTNHTQGTAYSADITPGSNEACYVIPYNTKDDKGNYNYNFYTTLQEPTCRNNIDNNWNSTEWNMTWVDDNTFYKEWTKEQIGTNAKVWFRIYYWDTQLYKKNESDLIPIAGSTTDYNMNANESSWSFGVEVPTYDYDKIRVTVKSNSSTPGYTISADAYISKTVTGANHYATFGTTVPVDLSTVTGVTAYEVKANSNGQLTMNTRNNVLAANEGILFYNESSEDKNLSIPVAADNSQVRSSNNDLYTFTGGDSRLEQPTSGNETYYILSKDANNKVGFFKVNSTSGNAMGENTAYLSVPAANAARSFFLFDDETTGIEAVKAANLDDKAYNLNGQRVVQPVKGLYIVNGKKVIMK